MNKEDCSNCTGCSRRDFLRGAAGAVVALTAITGSAHGVAMPVFEARGIDGGEDALRYAVPAADGALIDKDNQVIVLRQGKRAYAFALSCPHQRTMLKWLPDQNRFQCPKHKSKYQPDGKFISGRATRGMDRLAIKLQAGELVVNKSVVFRDDKDAAGWAAAAVTIR